MGCRRLRTLFISLIVVMIVLTVLHHPHVLILDLRDDSFSEVSKCPACYGDNLCSLIKEADIQLSGLDSWTISRHFNTKNVFRGFWSSRNMSVIIKKLGYDSELEQLDKKICKIVNIDSEHCDPQEAIKQIRQRITDDDELFKLKDLRNNIHVNQDWLQCGDQDLVNFVTRASLNHKSKPSLENILTMMMINQEPLIAMTFPPEQQFPFPEYLGSCGRVAVFSDAGPSISKMSQISSWVTRYNNNINTNQPKLYHFSVRAAVSWDLLQISSQLSKTSNNLALYPTDWESGHLCVDRYQQIKPNLEKKI